MRNPSFVISAALSFGAIFGVAAASAADLPARTYTKAPSVVAEPFNWTGFYAGANAGYAWSPDNSVSVVAAPNFSSPFFQAAPFLPGAVAGATGNIAFGRSSGFAGGGQIGYNYQFNNLVAGIEADIQALTGRASGALLTTLPVLNVASTQIVTATTVTKSVEWLGTVRGRLGLAVTPGLLVYGTGGLAYGDVKSNVLINQQIVTALVCSVCGPYSLNAGAQETRIGYAVGAGAEWMIASHWSAKIEYLYYDLGKVSGSGAASNVITVPTAPVLYTIGATTSGTRFNGDIIRVGLNYQFGGPVVSKY